MHPVDWLCALIPLLVVFTVGFFTQRYMKSVADFMSGSRLAGPYLLAVARGEMQAGAVVFVAMFEVIANSGFTLSWWGWISAPIYLIGGGWIAWRWLTRMWRRQNTRAAAPDL